MAAASVLALAVGMSRLAEQQQPRGYSWPPTPPRWAREEQNEVRGRAQHADDPPIIVVSDGDSSDDEAGDGHSTQQPPDSRHIPAVKVEREGKEDEEMKYTSTAMSIATVAGDGESSSDGDEDDEEESGAEERKAHDSEETEDEDDAALDEVAASGSVVQDIRDVQHEDFNASQRELQEEAEVAAAAAVAQPSMMEQQRDKRRHDAVGGASDQSVNKQPRTESPVIAEPKHGDEDEPMIDEVRTKTSSGKPSVVPAAITPPTHTYFASSSPAPSSASVPAAREAQAQQASRQPTAQQITAVTQPPVIPSASASRLVASPSLQPSNATVSTMLNGASRSLLTPVTKLLRSVVHFKRGRPLTLNLSPLSTLFYKDPDTCTHPANTTAPTIGRTFKKLRSQLAAWQLLQRHEELEEELAAADEAMEKDEQAGKEVADKWEDKTDALQEEMDEIEEELEVRDTAERERDRKEREGWYKYCRLGATEEEVKLMNEEDAKAEAELGYGDSSDDDVDDSEESAEEEEGGAEEVEKKEPPAPTSPPSNPFEKGERPAAAHFKNALNEWQEYYHINEDEYKRITERVWAEGGFVSGLFFEKGRIEEPKGGRQVDRKEMKKKEAKQEVRDESKEEHTDEKRDVQRAVDSKETSANKENVPVKDNSPKLSPPAPLFFSPTPVAFPPVRSNKPTKPVPPPAPSLFSKSFSPPTASAQAPPPPSSVAPFMPAPTVEPRPVVRPAAVSSFFSTSASTSSLTSSSPANRATSSRIVVRPQLSASSNRPANMVVNGGGSASRIAPPASADDLIDLTDDD